MSDKNDFTMEPDSGVEMTATAGTNEDGDKIVTVTGSNAFSVTPTGGAATNYTVTAGKDQDVGKNTSTAISTVVLQGQDAATLIGKVTDTNAGFVCSAAVSYDMSGVSTVTLSWEQTEGWEGTPLTGSGFIVSGHGDPEKLFESGGY